MKLLKIPHIVVLFILTAISLNAGATIADPGLTAQSSGENVVISWQTLEETNVKNFVVQRKTKGGVYTEVGTVLPESDQDYEYIDETAYKTTTSVYIYRIAIVDNNGTVTYTNEVTVLHDNISGVKKTWGSIKALFR